MSWARCVYWDASVSPIGVICFHLLKSRGFTYCIRSVRPIEKDGKKQLAPEGAIRRAFGGELADNLGRKRSTSLRQRGRSH